MTRGEGGWLFLPPAGLSPAILRQFAWRTPAGPRQRRAHRPPAQPRPASADRCDVARRRTRRPRAPRPSAAARVGGQPPEPRLRSATGPRGAPPHRGASPLHCARSPPDSPTGPTPVRSGALASGLPPRHRNGGNGGGNPRDHPVGPCNPVAAPKLSRLKSTFGPCLLANHPVNKYLWGRELHGAGAEDDGRGRAATGGDGTPGRRVRGGPPSARVPSGTSIEDALIGVPGQTVRRLSRSRRPGAAAEPGERRLHRRPC